MNALKGFEENLSLCTRNIQSRLFVALVQGMDVRYMVPNLYCPKVTNKCFRNRNKEVFSTTGAESESNAQLSNPGCHYRGFQTMVISQDYCGSLDAILQTEHSSGPIPQYLP